ncbi:MAG: hypothetical protein AAFR32_11120, partial [Pseudomonadota bacterium]
MQLGHRVRQPQALDDRAAVYMGPRGGSVIKRLRLTDAMPELRLMDLYQHLSRIYSTVAQAQHTDMVTRVEVDTDKNEVQLTTNNLAQPFEPQYLRFDWIEDLL